MDFTGFPLSKKVSNWVGMGLTWLQPNSNENYRVLLSKNGLKWVSPGRNWLE